MKDSNPLLEQVAQKIAKSQNNLSTEAGLPNSSSPSSSSQARGKVLSTEEKEHLIDSINQSFELLRLNYHHLYFSAYKELEELNFAKRLWMESLSLFNPDIILSAVHSVIKTSDYLPTISQIIRACTELSTDMSLPNVHEAYRQACNAPSPKTNAAWSHPAVYYAGKQSDWYFLANNTERVAFPVFKAHYEKLCQQVIDGVALSDIMPLALPNKEADPLSKEENIQRMEKLRKEMGI
ncbi:MAG: hypothetical protein ACJAYG_002423 [Oceanicoccus sp.]|jgi:hypothetical protein